MSRKQLGEAWIPGQRVAITTIERSYFRGRPYWVLGDEAVLVRRYDHGSWVVMVNDHEFLFSADELTDKTTCGECQEPCRLLTTVAGRRSIGTWVHTEMPETPHKAFPFFDDSDICRCKVLSWPHHFSPACYTEQGK